MKTKLFLFFLIGALQFVQGQDIVKDLPDFSSVQVTNGLTVELVKSDKNQVVISGQSRDKIEVNQTEGILNIKYSLSNLWREDDTSIKIYFKDLNNVEARQKSTVEIRGRLEQKNLRLRLQEGSRLSGNLNVEDLYASVVTGSHLELGGKAIRQEIEIKTAGEFWGENLKGKNVRVTVGSSAKANIFASEYVNATAKTGGQIYIYGDPDDVDQEIVFGGTIKKIN